MGLHVLSPPDFSQCRLLDRFDLKGHTAKQSVGGNRRLWSTMMHRPDSSYIAIFDSQIPKGFLEDSVRCLMDCYRQSDKASTDTYPKPVAHDYRPGRRRADFEARWPLVAERYSGMSTAYQPNHAGNCWHIEITCGSVIITQSFLDAKCKAVRHAVFRETLARRSENWLFADMAPSAPRPDAPLYAMLAHDVNPKDQSQPILVEVRFPDPSGEIVARIDLISRFPHLFTEVDSIPEVPIVDDLDMGFHEGVKEKRKSV